MKNIRLKSLEIQNFKGEKHFCAEFNEGDNYFIGDNRTGKTRFMDAYLWLLTGKDHLDRKDYRIKNYDKDGNIIHNLICSVEALFDVDGKEISLKREYVEDWKKDKKTGLSEIKGNKTNYTINSVSGQREKDYLEFVQENFCQDSIFKILTNPLYFPTILEWPLQRAILFEIVGDISEKDVIEQNEKFSFLSHEIEKKTLADYKRQLKAEISTMSKKVESELPTRIDETLKNMPDEIDFDYQKEKKEKLLSELKALEAQQLEQSEKVKAAGIEQAKIQKEINALFIEKDNLIGKICRERNGERNILLDEIHKVIEEISDYKKSYYNAKQSIEQKQKEIKALEVDAENLRIEYKEKASQKFEYDQDALKCYACGRPFPEENQREIAQQQKGSFMNKKASLLEGIKAKGLEIKGKIEKLKDEILSETSVLDDIVKKSTTLKDIEVNLKRKIEEKSIEFTSGQAEKLPDIISISDKITALSKKQAGTKPASSNELSLAITDKGTEIYAIDTKLLDETTIKNKKKREAELRDEMIKLSKLIFEKSQILDSIEEVIVKRVSLLEEKVNKMFKFVKFSLFHTQINGDLKEVCEATFQGVPFGTLNTESQLNCALDINNVLSNFYCINLPKFIDNREAVSKILVETNAQLIHLFKVEGEKKLTKFEKEPRLILK